MQPLKPGPELKKVDGFVGTWTLEGSTKPGIMGPGGPVAETGKCDWMEGGFYLVCHLEYKGAIATERICRFGDIPLTTRSIHIAHSTALANSRIQKARLTKTHGDGRLRQRWAA